MSYLKPNTKKAIKIAIAIKGFTASIATAAYLVANAEAALVVAIIGAVANEVINCLSDSEDPKTLI